MKYDEVEKIIEKAFNKFPIHWAFGNAQFKEMLKEMGTTVDKIVSIGAGGYILEKDVKKYINLLKWAKNLRKKARESEEYIYEMFKEELNNHEYCYTRDVTDTLDALGLTLEEINSDPKLLKGFELALAEYNYKDC